MESYLRATRGSKFNPHPTRPQQLGPVRHDSKSSADCKALYSLCSTTTIHHLRVALGDTTDPSAHTVIGSPFEFRLCAPVRADPTPPP